MGKLAEDSDSSDGNEGDYTDTGILLGYASKTPTEDLVSHIGGIPDWLLPSAPPSASFAKCQNCNGLLVLLLQLNGELPKSFPTHERRLFVFSCRKKTCTRKKGSIRAFRSVRSSHEEVKKRVEDRKIPEAEISTAKAQESQSTNIGGSLFGTMSTASSSKLNPFSTSESSRDSRNPFSNSTGGGPSTHVAFLPSGDSNRNMPTASTILPTFAETLSLGKKDDPAPASSEKDTEDWPAPDKFPPPFPSYFLDADFETLEKAGKDEISQRVEIDQAPSSGGERGEDNEVFESTLDKTFQRFADQLAQNPEQILRYEFDGTPLLYSSQDSVGQLFSKSHANSKISTIQSSSRIPRCSNCGNARVFELQLTPHAIIELESEELGLEGMEWGTVLMGVCSKDCIPRGVGVGEVGYLEEWVGVQWEESGNRR